MAVVRIKRIKSSLVWQKSMLLNDASLFWSCPKWGNLKSILNSARYGDIWDTRVPPHKISKIATTNEQANWW